MNNAPQQLYEEFLEHYHLNIGFFNHAVELCDQHLAKIEKLRVATFAKVQIPASEAVKNSVVFKRELAMAQAEADRELRKIIASFRTFRMDEDDMNRMCDWIEHDVLGKLLWPFHMLTVEAELEVKDFYPIANEMEAIVCDFLDAVDDYCWAFVHGEEAISRQTREEISEKNRQTDRWAANAPLEVRGSARIEGGRLNIYANVRSTVTEGQVNAGYQVNALLANQEANRRRDAQQKQLLNDLENRLLPIIKRYISVWYDCLEHKLPGSMVGKNVIAAAVYSTACNVRPDMKENAKKLLVMLNGEEDFGRIEYILRYYEHDLDDIYGEKVAIQIFNDYIRNKKVDEENYYYRLFCYFYDIEHPVEHTLLFKRLKKLIVDRVRETCEKGYQKDPEKYNSTPCDAKLGAFYRLIDAIPGLTDKQHREMVNACRYVHYDVNGDISKRDIYDEKNGVPVFDWTPD